MKHMELNKDIKAENSEPPSSSTTLSAGTVSRDGSNILCNNKHNVRNAQDTLKQWIAERKD